MRFFYVTFQIPAYLESAKAAHLESGIQALLHALRPPPSSPGVGDHAPLGGALVQLAKGPDWLVSQLVALSPDIRFLIMPQQKAKSCVTHPPELLALLTIDRADWEVTCLKFSQTAATLPKRRRGVAETVKSFFGS